MSYDPSHHKPPRQERWPAATPPEGWPSYRDGDAYRDADQADSRYAADRQGAYPAAVGYQQLGYQQLGYQQLGYQQQGASGGWEGRGYQSSVATDAFPPATNGYDSAAGYGAPGGYGDARDDFDWTENGHGGNGYAGGINGYAGAADDFAGYQSAVDGYADAGDSFADTADRYSRTEVGYGQATGGYVSDASIYDWSENSYGSTANGYGSAVDDFAGARDEFPGSAGYLGPGSYTEPGLSDPMLAAPDVGVDPYRWQADQDLRREAGRRGLIVGAVTGVLAVAVAIGVSTLIAGFVRPEASPMAALGSMFIDRTPTALKNAMVQHFGTNGRTVLLLGMYAAIAVLAVGIGVLARRAAGPAVAGLAAFSLLAAFLTITRPGGRVSDVAPAVIGGIAGVAALLWLMQASAPAAPVRNARGNSRRRA